MDDHRRPWQDTRVHAADAGDMQETILDGGDHHADGVHVGGDHDGRSQRFA